MLYWPPGVVRGGLRSLVAVSIVMAVDVQVISHAGTGGYSRLMSRIKSEYEQMISALERGYEDGIYLSGKIREIDSIPMTLTNYQLRNHDLLTK